MYTHTHLHMSGMSRVRIVDLISMWSCVGMMSLAAVKYSVTCPECEFPGDAARLVNSDTRSVSENSPNVSGSMSGWRDRSLSALGFSSSNKCGCYIQWLHLLKAEWILLTSLLWAVISGLCGLMVYFDWLYYSGCLSLDWMFNSFYV